MARTLHWMTLAGHRLAERRGEAGAWETVGFVEEAAYLRRTAPSWWASLFGARPTLALAPPFDAEGRDAHALFDEHIPALEGHDGIQQVRRATGRVVCLSPREAGDTVVLRDLWLEGARALDAVQFGLETPFGPPVAVAFVQMPLVIARPEPCSLAAYLDGPHVPLVSAALGSLPHGATGQLVELREGDQVDVLGLAWDPDRCERRFDLAGRTASYREVDTAIRLVLGDAPGLRMVIRKR
jgi:hypothetical protein